MEKHPRDSQGTYRLSMERAAEVFTVTCRVRFRRIVQFLHNLLRYYLWHPRFFLLDMAVLLQYFFKSPFKILKESSQDLLFGETDFSQLAHVLDAFHVPRTARIVDCGAGRGRLALWLALARRQRAVVAIEQCETFCVRLQRIARWVPHLTVSQGLWEEFPFRSDDVLYFYQTPQTDAQAASWAQALAQQPASIIAVGSWLCDEYPDSFHTIASTSMAFEWGQAEVRYMRSALKSSGCSK